MFKKLRRALEISDEEIVGFVGGMIILILVTVGLILSGLYME